MRQLPSSSALGKLLTSHAPLVRSSFNIHDPAPRSLGVKALLWQDPDGRYSSLRRDLKIFSFSVHNWSLVRIIHTVPLHHFIMASVMFRISDFKSSRSFLELPVRSGVAQHTCFLLICRILILTPVHENSYLPLLYDHDHVFPAARTNDIAPAVALCLLKKCTTVATACHILLVS